MLANLVIIAASDGGEIARIPIYQMAPNGLTILNDMRFIESSGWINEHVAYVFGSVHPREPTLETFDTQRGTPIESLYPKDFAVCPAKKRFAQAPLADSSISIDGRKVYTGNDDDMFSNLTWNHDCTQLAFFRYVHGDDSKAPDFLLLRGEAVEHAPFSQEYEGSTLYAVGDTFIATRPDGPYLMYDMTARGFQPPSKAVQERVNAKNKIAQTFLDLGIGPIIETKPDVLTLNKPITQVDR